MGYGPDDPPDSEDNDVAPPVEATPSTKEAGPSAPVSRTGPPPPPPPPDGEEVEVAVQSAEPEPESESEEEEDACCFHRSQFVGISGEDCLEFHAQEPWPQDVKLFQPYEVEQILLPDNANCLAVQAYLKMCGLDFEVEPRHNAEYMSPSGRVPFIKCGAFVVSELDPIIGFISTKGVSLSDKMDPAQKADMRAYMSLVNTVLANAELYVTWVDSTTVREVTKPRNGSVYPWPLNHFINWQKSSQVKRKLSVLGWYQKSLDEVYREVENCCNALSERLENKEYFFGSSPSELDCSVYGHLYAILTTPNETYTRAYNQLANLIRDHQDLIRLVKKIDSSYFGRSTRISVCVCPVDETNREPPPPPPPPPPEEDIPPPPPPPPPEEGEPVPEAAPPEDKMEEMD